MTSDRGLVRACIHCHRAIRWNPIVGAYLHTHDGRRQCRRGSITQPITMAEAAQL